MESQSKEDRVQLALNAFKKGQFKTKKAVSLAFDVPATTLRRRIQGIASRSQKAANCRKLSATEESTLSAWILDMDKRGLPLQLSTVRHLAQLLASARLPSSQPTIIGEHWVNRYIQRHPELKSKYTRKDDYQRAKCERILSLFKPGSHGSGRQSRIMGSWQKISIIWMRLAFRWV